MPALRCGARPVPAVIALVCVASPALAHEAADPAGSPSLACIVAATMAVYALGVARLWVPHRRGRGLKTWQVASFVAGIVLVALATLSPLHAMGRGSFAAHMVEHEILMVLAAPLIVLGGPGVAVLGALPRRWRPPAARYLAMPPLRIPWRALSGGGAATALHGAIVWMGHLPAFFAAALVSEGLHDLQHVAFMASALVFWHAVLEPARRGAAVIWLLLTSLHTGFLGILLTVAPRVLVPLQGDGAESLGLTPLEDQQIAGLVMWVPAGLVYAAVALALAGVWIAGSSRHAVRGPAVG